MSRRPGPIKAARRSLPRRSLQKTPDVGYKTCLRTQSPKKLSNKWGRCLCLPQDLTATAKLWCSTKRCFVFSTHWVLPELQKTNYKACPVRRALQNLRIVKFERTTKSRNTLQVPKVPGVFSSAGPYNNCLVYFHICFRLQRPTIFVVNILLMCFLPVGPHTKVQHVHAQRWSRPKGSTKPALREFWIVVPARNALLKSQNVNSTICPSARPYNICPTWFFKLVSTRRCCWKYQKQICVFVQAEHARTASHKLVNVHL